MIKTWIIHVVVGGVILTTHEGRARTNKEKKIKEVLDNLHNGCTAGALYVTEDGARQWAVWSIAAGAKEAHRTGAVEKVDRCEKIPAAIATLPRYGR